MYPVLAACLHAVAQHVREQSVMWATKPSEWALERWNLGTRARMTAHFNLGQGGLLIPTVPTTLNVPRHHVNSEIESDPCRRVPVGEVLLVVSFSRSLSGASQFPSSGCCMEYDVRQGRVEYAESALSRSVLNAMPFRPFKLMDDT